MGRQAAAGREAEQQAPRGAEEGEGGLAAVSKSLTVFMPRRPSAARHQAEAPYVWSRERAGDGDGEALMQVCMYVCVCVALVQVCPVHASASLTSGFVGGGTGRGGWGGGCCKKGQVWPATVAV